MQRTCQLVTESSSLFLRLEGRLFFFFFEISLTEPKQGTCQLVTKSRSLCAPRVERTSWDLGAREEYATKHARVRYAMHELEV
jgi:hypothetical protein